MEVGICRDLHACPGLAVPDQVGAPCLVLGRCVWALCRHLPFHRGGACEQRATVFVVLLYSSCASSDSVNVKEVFSRSRVQSQTEVKS